jgi:hypothetical protein
MIRMMAITINSSISEKPNWRRVFFTWNLFHHCMTTYVP